MCSWGWHGIILTRAGGPPGCAASPVAPAHASQPVKNISTNAVRLMLISAGGHRKAKGKKAHMEEATCDGDWEYGERDMHGS